MIVAELVFWASLAALVYTYVGFIVLLWFLSLFRKKTIRKNGGLPTVSLIFCVLNEQEVLETKLQNCLDLDYPTDRLEVVVISDGSSDRSNDIINSFTQKSTLFIGHLMPENLGKTQRLNEFVPSLRGDILFFTDANAFLPVTAIRDLAGHFTDPSVGLVTGSTAYCSHGDQGHLASVSLYTRLEHLIKLLESRIGSCVGSDGAIFAMRRELFRPLLAGEINDFVLPLHVVRQGFRCILAQHVKCVENVATQGRATEFQRQVRITVRTLRALLANADLMNPLRYPGFSFELISHKVMKFLSPFFLILALTFNIALALHHAVYAFLLAVHLSFYLLALCGHVLKPGHRVQKLTSMPYSFALFNAAVFKAWGELLAGKRYVTWRPAR